MPAFYSFLMIFIGSLVMYLYFQVMFNVDLPKKRVLAFLLCSTVVVGLNVVLLQFNIYRGLLAILFNLLITKLFFRLSWSKTVLAVGLYFVTTILGESFSSIILSIAGMSITSALYNIGISLLVNFITLTSMLSFILVYSILFKKNVATSYDSNLTATFVAASLFSLALVSISYVNALETEQPFPMIVGVILMSLFALSILIFFVSNKLHSVKKGENVRLINDVRTIKSLNQQLEAEIEERKKLEEQLQFYATTDSLTGVLNRNTGLLMLENAMKEAKRNNQSVTICFIDINFLKQINDAYGHNEGDKLIVIVSTVLKEALRESDSICRLGGDEFLLILPNCNEEQAQEVGARIEDRMEHYNALEQKPYKIGLSYGFAEYSSCCSQSIEELLENADRRMYQMKQGARSAIHK